MKRMDPVWCRKKLIEALQTGDEAVLAKFATDDSHSSSPSPADGLLNAPQSRNQAQEGAEGAKAFGKVSTLQLASLHQAGQLCACQIGSLLQLRLLLYGEPKG